jgi:hypothetical protein
MSSRRGNDDEDDVELDDGEEEGRWKTIIV